MKRSLILLLTIPLHGSPIPDFPFIAVRAESTMKVPPSRAEVQCKVFHHAKTAEDATRRVNETLKKLVSELQEAGLEGQDVQAHDIDKTEVRARGEDLRERQIIGYDVTRWLILQVGDLEIYSDVVRALMKADHVIRIESTFGTDKENEVEEELLVKACSKARRRADLLAKAAGQSITGVHAVSEDGFRGVSERFLLGKEYYGAGGILPALSSPAEEDPPLFVPDSIGFESSVDILYTLADPEKR